MTLRQKQSLFAQLAARLILRAFEMGYEVTLGDAYRDPRCPYGSEVSLHRQRLALDLNLFKDGRYLKSTDAHRPLGEWWMAQHELCEWGGSENRNDGNHYSLRHGNRW